MLLYEFIAILHGDFIDYGCPHCGHHMVDPEGCVHGKADLFTCCKCGRMFVTLKNGIEKSPISYQGFYPKVQPHPRKTMIKKLLLCLSDLLAKKGEMRIKEFHLGDILSIARKISVSLSAKGKIKLLGFMTGAGGKLHDLYVFLTTPSVDDICRGYLLEQMPWLLEINISQVNEKNWKKWLKEIAEKYGEYHKVKSIPKKEIELVFADGDVVCIKRKTLIE